MTGLKFFTSVIPFLVNLSTIGIIRVTAFSCCLEAVAVDTTGSGWF